MGSAWGILEAIESRTKHQLCQMLPNWFCSLPIAVVSVEKEISMRRSKFCVAVRCRGGVRLPESMDTPMSFAGTVLLHPWRDRNASCVSPVIPRGMLISLCSHTNWWPG